MGKRNLAVLIGLLLLGGLFAVLTGGIERPESRAAGGATDAKEGMPRRIAIVTPSICEIVFHIGCGDRVVGVSDFCIYPPEATKKEKLGGWMNPNRERIIALHPDLLMTQGRHESVATLCQERGIAFFSLEIESLADIRAALTAVGARLGVRQRAEESAREWEATLDQIRARTAQRRRPKVFLTFSRQPGVLTGLMTPNRAAFLSDLVEIAGGTNVFSDIEGQWPTISKETLVVREPEVILELYPETLTEEKREALRKDWDNLPSIPAVKERRIYFLTGDHLLIPSPRVTLTAEAMARALHPEAFCE